MSLPKGKLSFTDLKRLVFKHLPLAEDSRELSLDFSVATTTGHIVTASDPVIGVPLNTYGFFAVHYSATDVAMSGATPRFLSLGVYYPPGTPETWLDENMRQLGNEARRLGIRILGGHTGGYDGLNSPLISTTCLGILLDEVRLPSSIKPGDTIIAVGPIGRETLWFLANINPEQVNAILDPVNRKQIADNLNPFVVAPIVLQLPKQEILLMHDLAEGGLATGLHELSKATTLGIKINYSSVPWDKPALEVFSSFKWNPLDCSSFGSFLLVTEQDEAEPLLEKILQQDRPAAIIGKFTKDQKLIFERDGKNFSLEQGTDPYQKYTDRIH